MKVDRGKFVTDLIIKQSIEDFVDGNITKKQLEAKLDERLSNIKVTLQTAISSFYLDILLDTETIYSYDASQLASVAVAKKTVGDSIVQKLVLFLHPILLSYDKTTIQLILKHEMLHIVFGHLYGRSGKEKDDKWAWAIDCAVNQLIEMEQKSKYRNMQEFIDEFGGISLTQIRTLCNACGVTEVKELETAEYYYKKLVEAEANKKQQQSQQKQQSTEGKDNDEEDNSDENTKNNENPKPSSRDGKQQQSQGQDKTCDLTSISDSKDIDWGMEDVGNNHQPSELTEEEAKALASVIGSRSTDKMTPMIRQIFENQFKTVTDWKRALFNNTASIIHGKKPTTRRRNRRDPDALYKNGKLNDKTINIKIVIDTSGSIIGDAEYFLGEIKNNIFKDFKEIEVAEVDTEVRRVYKITEKFKMSGAAGGGGTVLEPGIKYFTERYKDKPDVIIIFTDGYCDSHIDNPRTNLIWVVTDDKNNLCTNPCYGKVIEFHR